MAIINNLLPKALKGHDIPHAQPNLWQKMELPEQFIDSIDTTGGDLDNAAKFNLLVSSVPSPWARVLLTQHAIATKINPDDDRTLSQFYNFLRSEWRGLMAAFVLYPEDFELTKPIELVAKGIEHRDGKFDIISTYANMLFENEALWKYDKGDNETPKMQILYYKKGDRRFPVGGTSPFSILFPGMNYKLAADEQRIYWTPDGKFEDPADKKFESYYKKGEAKFNDKHLDNLKKLYSFLNGVQKNTVKYTETLAGIWNSNHRGEAQNTTDARYNKVQQVLNAAISDWMKELENILGATAEKSKNIPVNNPRPEGPLGDLLSIKTTYYWHGNAFHTKPEINPATGEILDTIIENVEDLFIDSDYLALWRDFSTPVNDPSGRPTNKKEHDYSMAPIHFLTATEDGKKWFLAMPLSEFAMSDVFKNEFESIIKGKNDNVKIEAQKHGNRVEVYLKARINSEGEWINIRNRSFNVEIPDQNKKVFAWPNFSSEKWQKYYYYSEFPANSLKDVQMIPVFEEMESIEDTNKTNDWAPEAFLRMVNFPNDATSDDHTYEIIRTNKPLKRIKIRKRIGNSLCDLGWLVIRKENSVNPDEPQAMQIISKDRDLSPVDVGFDFGSTNSCAYYSGRGDRSINPIRFSNRRLAIIGFDNKPIETAEKNELLFISNEEPVNKNGQIKSWLHEHDHRFIDESMMSEELIGGVPVNETNIKVMDMDRYDIQTNAGKLHYNMKWLSDAKGNQRKQAFIKMVWIHLCADLFAEGLFPAALNWSYPSAMDASESGLENIFNNIPSPCPDYTVSEKTPYTEAEAVCSYFLGKNISLEKDRLFVGVDIGGSTSDILVLGRDNGKKNVQHETPAPAPTPVVAPVASVDYDELSRKELVDLVKQRGLSGKIDTDEVSRKELVDFLKANESFGQVDYDELSRKELVDLVKQRGLSGKIDTDEVSRKELVEFLKANEGGIDYDDFGRKELVELACQRGLGSATQLDDLSRKELVDLLKGGAPAATPAAATAPAHNYSNNEDAKTDRRLFTQCSVRMAAGVFFDAIINSKKFRDCIRTFHASRQTQIKVEDIETIASNPSRAPYYLNNIFDQLRGDKEFKKFYSYLKQNVPFVFTLPAYILGALMTYTGMLVRNAILTHNLKDIDEVHLRYFGKGGRLFEWLFYTIQPELVSQYLDACFAVGLKNELINKHFGRQPGERVIHCIFDNVKDPNYGNNDQAENKSEVAIGLVSRQDIRNIVDNSKSFYNTSAKKDADAYDARKQEVLGEMGFARNGHPLDDLTHVDDNFYRNEGEIDTPRKFENFEEFMNVFFTFVSKVTHVYDETKKLADRIEGVSNVRAFITRDPEYVKYMNNIRARNDGHYRMPIFIASALFYLEEVLLEEVFSRS